MQEEKKEIEKKEKKKNNTCVWILCGILFAILLVAIIIALVLTLRTRDKCTDEIIGGLLVVPNNKSNPDEVMYISQGPNGSWSQYVDKLEQYLQAYELPSKTAAENMVICTWDFPPPEGKFCNFHLSELARGINHQIYTCTRSENFGYDKGRPCILIHPSMDNNWQPDYYTHTDELPLDMPIKLQNYIRALDDSKQRKTVWMTCEGQTPADQELVGPIDYSASGFRSYHLEGRNVTGYLGPIIAVQLIQPANGVTISVVCRMWAKNIPDAQASVHFKIYIEE